MITQAVALQRQAQDGEIVVDMAKEVLPVVRDVPVLAAGGIVTDWKGRPAHAGGRIIAAANPTVHAEALEILARCDD